jgi:predicted transcriptional regulator
MNDAERKAVNIMMSPCRVDILNKLSEANSGLTSKEIKNKMSDSPPSMVNHLEDHLEELIREGIITQEDVQYRITDQGKRVYERMQNIAKHIELTV